MPAVGKKLSHFVSRFYLRAWAENGLIFCLSNGRIFRPNLMGVAAENYFYKLQELTNEEIRFLGMFINDSPEPLRESHRQIVRIHMAPFIWKRILEEDGGGTPEQFETVERMIREINEDLHTTVEENFNPFISSMIGGDLSFFKAPETTAQFYGGLSVQFARTKFIRGTMKTMPEERFKLYMKLSNILVVIMSLNVGASLFGDAANRTPYLMENNSPVPFVTADQPIINLASNPKTAEQLQRFELYYPVSPNRALLLLEPNSAFVPKSLTVSAEEARLYNLRIASFSYRQVYSNSEEELKALSEELNSYMASL